MMFKKKRNETFDASLITTILNFVWPIMLANVLQITFHFADTVVIGNFTSKQGLAAVGTTGPLTIFFTWGLAGLSLGINVLVSRMIGEKKYDSIRQAVFTGMFIGLMAGLVVSFIGITLSGFFLKLLGTPADIFADALLYMRIYFISAIPIGVFDFGMHILRSSGDSKRPTLYLSISGALNVILNLIFVVVLKMYIAGVALATVISQFVAAILVVIRLIKEDGYIHLDLNFENLNFELFKKILHYGIPSLLQNQMFSFSNMAIQSSINSFGSLMVAANTAANSIEEFVYVFCDAFPQASLTYTSRSYGARDLKSIRKLMIANIILCTIGSFAIGFISFLNGRSLLSLVASDAQIIELGMIRLRHVTLFLFLNGILDVIVNSIRGMGLSILPTIVTLFGVCGFRIAYIMTYFRINHQPDILYNCFPLSWLITIIIQFILWLMVYHHNLKSLSEN